MSLFNLSVTDIKKHFATFDFFVKMKLVSNMVHISSSTHKRQNLIWLQVLHKTKSVRNHGIHGEKFCNYHKSLQFVQSFFEIADRILILKSHNNPVAEANL